MLLRAAARRCNAKLFRNVGLFRITEQQATMPL